ncbi:cytochrome P450 (plasmid) [Nostoc sp. C057]|uniref:cytochrome P450 n=1 Tax=Nostoc sp. C057 TaxID=2576903 RepID=UPI0015C30B85|nr:cytochrome P450 [Nostoc sp. C057]QLE53998.1 cytochrome P450 [Nostoc sp. C057]
MKYPNGSQTSELMQTIQYILTPLEYLDKCAKTYGDIFSLRLIGFPPYVVLSNPQGIKEVFTAAPNLFYAGEANKYLPQTILGASSLVLIDGDYHQRQRRLLTPAFHGERMQAYGQLICDITKQVMSKWTIDKPFNVRSSMQDISLQVILKAVFGLDAGLRFQQLKQLLSSMMDVFSSSWSSSFLFIQTLQWDLGPWSVWGSFLRFCEQADELIYAEIRQRRNDPNLFGEDILSFMMTACDEEGQPMTDVELRDELITLLVAGHETTATALTWALYWIHYLPEVRESLLTELEVLRSNPEPTDVARLPYLNAVCSETLRIYPVTLFTFSRIVQAPVQIMGYQFEPGTMISPCIYLTHHREDLYPEPWCFRPERFLKRQFSPYEFLPFGGGNRRCLGMAFAQFEIKLVLATLLFHQKLRLVKFHRVKPVRRGLTIAPPGNLCLIPTS